VIDGFELTNGHSFGITADNSASNYLMTLELQSPLDASVIMRTAVRTQIPCMAHIIQLISCIGFKDHNMSLETHDLIQQFGVKESTDIGKSQRRRNEGNASINKVSPMELGLAKIIGKVGM
jgi:hypothetical protein